MARPSTFAAMVLLSAMGTLRAILVLVIIWQLLRIISKVQSARTTQQHGQPPLDRRSKGEVRIEHVDPRKEQGHPGGTIEDADFEEIR